MSMCCGEELRHIRSEAPTHAPSPALRTRCRALRTRCRALVVCALGAPLICCHAQVEPAQLVNALCSRSVGGGVIEATRKPLTPPQAKVTRNSLCMHLYSLAFG